MTGPRLIHIGRDAQPPGRGGVATVPAWRDGPTAPDVCVVLAPGAGAPATSPFMTELAAALARRDLGVVRFDFPYQVRAQAEGRRRPPDRAPVCEAVWRDVYTATVDTEPGVGRFALGGKSMGGRMASHVLAAGDLTPTPCGGVFFGYPLHASGRPEKLRADHLAGIAVPLLFLQGDRDALARLDLLEPVVAGCGTSAALQVIAGADHDFAVPKRLGRPRTEVIDELAGRSADWLRRTATGA